MNKKERNAEIFVNSLMRDEHGISEETYVHLLDYLETMRYYALLEKVKRCDATDGRFYFEEND